ncbi:hypothetical protein LET1_00008 [Pectobacterium phage LET1]|nr:hypothetical protein LET1_00008 [Pectobacterium phage LET1]
MFNRRLKAVIAQLEQKVKMQEYHLARANEEHHRLVTKLKRQSEEIENLKNPKPQAIHHAERMVGIKFRALFNGMYQPTEFKTGPGPCGKTVTYFTTARDDRHLTIIQKHTDGSNKKFIYRLSDIDGRIQEDWELVQLVGKEAEDAKRLEEAARFIIPRIA